MKVSRLTIAAYLIGGYVALSLPATADPVKEGKYLTAAAGCMACHTVKGDAEFAGGRALKTPFGTFYSPNITPDAQTGIGDWTEGEFLAALKRGVSPEGQHYFPAFPYTSYTRITDQDGLKIFAYLKSLPAVQQENKEHDVGAPFSWRWLQWGWKLLFFEEGQGALSSEGADRGQYLVDALGHCGECHTPRNALGGSKKEMYLAGAADGGEGELVSNITPDTATGIGDWSKSDLADFLKTAMKPDFDNVQGSMEEVIEHGTSKLSKEDREAIAAYLLSISPIRHKVTRARK